MENEKKEISGGKANASLESRMGYAIHTLLVVFSLIGVILIIAGVQDGVMAETISGAVLIFSALVTWAFLYIIVEISKTLKEILKRLKQGENQ